MMKQDVLDDVSARKFLLGDLSPEEQSAIEERAFLDRDTFTLLLAAEDDLIDEYVSGDLTAHEFDRFEELFVSEPARSADLRIGRAMQKYISKEAPSSVHYVSSDVGLRVSLLPWLNSRSLAMRLSLAAIVLLLAATGIWLAFRKQNEPLPIQAMQEKVPDAPPSTNKASETPKPVIYPDSNRTKPKLTPKQPATPIFSFLLVPGGTVRGESNITTVRLTSDSGIARLELPLTEGSSYGNYEATLLRDAGKHIRSWTNLEARVLGSGVGIQISVPMRLLEPRKRYRIVVRGVASGGKRRDIDNYYFQVEN